MISHINKYLAELRYPNITAGYIGIKKDNATLNSAFYAEYLGSDAINDITVFPQRVLRKDFFNEIALLEQACAGEQSENVPYGR